MTALQIGALILVGAGAPLVVLVRDPLRQAFCVGVFGTVLALLFFLFQAPDVALSQIVVSTVALPLMILLALAKIREHEEEEEEEQGEGE
jgi:energy-converting hydrogenase B subunit D